MAWLLGIFEKIGEWILPILIKDLVSALQSWWTARQKAAADKAQGAADAAKYQAVVDNPTATRDDREKAEGTLLNGD